MGDVDDVEVEGRMFGWSALGIRLYILGLYPSFLPSAPTIHPSIHPSSLSLMPEAQCTEALGPTDSDYQRVVHRVSASISVEETHEIKRAAPGILSDGRADGDEIGDRGREGWCCNFFIFFWELL